MTFMRVTVYAIPAAAIARFFEFPQSYVALTDAMLLQALASRLFPENPPQTPSYARVSRSC